MAAVGGQREDPPGGGVGARVPPGVIDALRPAPERGYVLAAGAVLLTAAILMINVRMDETWGNGAHLILALVAFVPIFAMGLLAPLEGDRPRAYQSILLITGLALLLIVLERVAQVLGVDQLRDASGTGTWIALVLAAAAGYAAWRCNSAISTLIGALAAGAALLAFVDFAFDPDGVATFRWILLLLIVAYALAAPRAFAWGRRHGVQLVNSAGVATIVLALTLQFFGFLVSFGSTGGSPFGWELVLVLASGGLIAYAAATREPGPGYLGSIALVWFVSIAGAASEDGATLVGWPLALLLIGAAALAAGLVGGNVLGPAAARLSGEAPPPAAPPAGGPPSAPPPPAPQPPQAPPPPAQPPQPPPPPPPPPPAPPAPPAAQEPPAPEDPASGEPPAEPLGR